ncbi:tyrosine-type recombinase/integrase [Alteribacillus iranensis]|uniref:Site-specific recombinase XerD n=1 Tax=Alteribacillus iranensis TaxID=930128 RepID=A0A1I2A064_9BACI|nr:tyrosine-type recombinase/integrase [Alteribacillus iranensis]SFE37484.1 Site-specific recombinase XerD [Alteribacillus iranensis]
MHQLPKEAERFLDYLAANQRKKSTIKRYSYDLADFFRYVEVVKGENKASSPRDLTPQLFETYFHLLESERGYQLRTLKRIQTVLKKYVSFLRKNGKLHINPLASLDLDESVWNTLSDEELLTATEEHRLLSSLKSDAGLSIKQAAARPLLAPRNLFIVSLFLYYGLRLQELSHLQMKHINQGIGTISIPEITGNPRVIQLNTTEKKLLHYYVKAIPAPVRPYKDTDPLLVAFDFQRKTYRWSYETDSPKNLTEVAIQKMIREERKRADITRAISARHFRNTFIIRELVQGTSPEELKDKLGLQTILTLNKYIEYVERNEYTFRLSRDS